ncbi:FKBP-type peptidyl-prolyl cis-trans isomerase [uncultured Microbacterium sp.]|uniref:FKBP-type peptidyl-prolyl cis-trans isomerase n=1 Tax=uncultured Microbacterium sp. TaxID=191216 RepID=UPI0028EECED1|nr:FKBP-type peptidyl-prolyl cis-trans isomerase [uncultured Microbacterium sp.]
MRLRPLAALSAVALSAILLAGCSGAGGGDASPSASASAAADLCSSAAPSGAVSDGITVTGDFGTVPTVDFTKPIDTTDLTLQRTVQTKGTGAAIAAGDFVNYAATILDGATGSVLSQAGYTPGEILPEQISADNGGQIFGCATVGSRLTLATATGNETTPSVVYVIDVLGITPTAAWGEEQAPVAGMPTVSLGDGGAPAITIPEGQTPPTETQVATLKKGDGPVVQAGNQVLLQYTGVRWSNGETFDSTWDKGGVPTSFATNKVVAGFQKALEGQTVGSQVLVTMTPADGYGEGDLNTTDLKGETLVFVIDILGTAPAATQ